MNKMDTGWVCDSLRRWKCHYFSGHAGCENEPKHIIKFAHGEGVMAGYCDKHLYMINAISFTKTINLEMTPEELEVFRIMIS